ncbi:MAG: hypothetical protein C5B47_03720 [Verrucomicrobia bacterium]|nr:MAG: hypothetical protein C5B47_03720 [Verrucomicrobiota bacterium]
MNSGVSRPLCKFRESLRCSAAASARRIESAATLRRACQVIGALARAFLCFSSPIDCVISPERRPGKSVRESYCTERMTRRAENVQSIRVIAIREFLYRKNK